MKIVIYTGVAGNVFELFPAPFARLCDGYVLGDQTVPCEPVSLDQLKARLGWSTAFTPVFAETEDAFVARIRDKDVPADASNVQIVDFEALPDQSFRKAWVFTSGAVAIDMTKARDVHRGLLRILRAPKLAALDVAWMRALESGDAVATAAVAARKKVLRDITIHPDIAAAQTPQQLSQAAMKDIGS